MLEFHDEGTFEDFPTSLQFRFALQPREDTQCIPRDIRSTSGESTGVVRVPRGSRGELIFSSLGTVQHGITPRDAQLAGSTWAAIPVFTAFLGYFSASLDNSSGT